MTDLITSNSHWNARPFSLLNSDDAIRSCIARHRVWIEQAISSPLEESIFIRVDFDMSETVVDHNFGFIEQPTQSAHVTRMRLKVESINMHSNYAPLVSFAESDPEASNHLLGLLSVPPPRRGIALTWRDCPVAVKLEGIPSPVVLLNIAYTATVSSHEESTAHLLITPKVQAREVLRLLAFIDSADHRARVHTANGPTRPVARLPWDQLILEPNIVKLLKDDFESFWARERWFRDRNLPFRRGYLLHGPPGNGKSSAIRAMMTSRGLSAYTLRMFDPHADDSDLEAVFERAAKHRPSIVLLEDLDRAFPRTGETKSSLSLQALLNCLDGVGTPEGIVVIATANEPSVLDPAILKRPGRFDRVVHFPNPSAPLRRDYFLKMHPGLDSEKLVSVVAESDGMSFAQLREAYILAGQRSFLRGVDISAEDLLTAVQSLRTSQMMAGDEGRSGFRL
jgi:hypothetical protein